MSRSSKRTNAVMGNLMFAPMVAAMRLPLFALESQRSGRPTETIRATAEKLSAFGDGILAAQMTYASAMLSFWPEVLMGRQPSLLKQATAETAMVAALEPAGRAVRANARRLSSKRTSR